MPILLLLCLYIASSFILLEEKEEEEGEEEGGKMLKVLKPDVSVMLTTNVEVARSYIAKGYEPIEYSVGQTSLLGELRLDHHGAYSHLPAVALRGQGELFGMGKHRYIINHMDADV
ncbi:MAG: hypothetical protein QXM92_02385, partial [Candidatus Anstonellales archaeon]